MTTDDDGDPKKGRERLPVGFLLVLLVTALYLGWRLVQGVGWAFEQLTG